MAPSPSRPTVGRLAANPPGIFGNLDNKELVAGITLFDFGFCSCARSRSANARAQGYGEVD